jgi:hypothetical protein
MRRARLRTTHADPEAVAAAIRPDNTDSMRTSVTDDAVETVIERETTGGLQSTVDDYVVNLAVAESVTTAVRDGDARRTHTTDNDQS